MRNVTRQALVILSLNMSLVLVGVSQADAGSLKVVDSAARIGVFGLEITVSSTCSGPSELNLTHQSLSGPATYEGCRTISSSSTEIANAGTVVFRAGERIALSDGFVVRSGASFIAEISRDLIADAYVEDQTPAAERDYSAGFFLRLDQLTVDGSDKLDPFTGYASDGIPWLWLTVKRNLVLDEYRLVIRARRDDNSVATTEDVTEAVIQPGWAWVALEWKAADVSTSNGYLRLYLDGVLYAELTDLGNSDGRIDTVRLGASNAGGGTSGSFDVDYFQSQRGEAPAPPM